jgi:phosphoglycerate kinase
VAKLSIRDVDLAGRQVLVRVDFNVPLYDGVVQDDTRLRASLPTIQHILDHGGRPILISHLGRPGGESVPELSLEPVADALDTLLDHKVRFVRECVGDVATAAAKGQAEGEVLLLENLRFHSEEEENSPAFAMKFSALGDVFVNDAFGAAHRAHASTEGLTHYFATCAAGLLIQKELDYLGRALSDPDKPFVAVMGGAKVSGKIDVITQLLTKVDTLLIGGGMAYTFFKAMGHEIGRSLLEEDRMSVAEEILRESQSAGVDLKLPVDCVVAPELSDRAETSVVDASSIPPDQEAADIGPKTRALFSEKITHARTIVWNGPMGVFEMTPFAEGTAAIAKAMAGATDNGATTVVGGGETAAAVANLGLVDRISHVSTGGGASLEFLEGKRLPGVEALSDVQ